MSTITTTREVCDRCGKDLRYPRLKVIFGKKKKVTAFASREEWGDGYPMDETFELCNSCRKEFDKFMIWRCHMNNHQCHMLNCRYNSGAKCTSERNYEICTSAIIGVLGEDRYNSFLRWEKAEIEKKKNRAAERRYQNE